MKLQHTSGAVIEDARIEERGDFFYTVCGVTRGCIYSKADWRRVPEERWERVRLGLDGKWLRVLNKDETVIGPTPLTDVSYVNMRYIIIDGNLCVERRVEGV